MTARILLVEDSAMLRSVTADALRRAGYMVDEVEDGVAGLAATEQGPYDLIITDLEMPRLDGLGFLRALRQRDSETLAMVLTAHTDVRTVLGAIREGMLFDYIVKPVEPAMLEMAVHRALDVQALRAKAREADQVRAMRELAMTAGDRILNPLNVVRLSLNMLRRDPSPANIAKAIQKLEAMSERIATVVKQMSRILRYTPHTVASPLVEIDLDQATQPLAPAPSETAPPTVRPTT